MDELLKKAFLETNFEDPKNEKLLEASAQAALGTTVAGGTTNPLRKVFSGSKLLMGIAAVTVVGITTWVYESSRNTPETVKPQASATVNNTASENAQASVAATEQAPVQQQTNVEPQQQTSAKVQPEAMKVIPIQSIPVNEVQQVINASVSQPENNNTPVVQPSANPNDSSYHFPVLTDKEIAANNKFKRMMIEWLVKQKGYRYAFVPMGSFLYKGVQTTVHAFYMENNTVSNIEYRTFLSDLLIHGRKSEFLIAKPDQKQWTNIPGLTYGQYMKENYFSNSKYDYYPVVNISRQGAEMFCKWLTEEGQPYFSEHSKGQKVIVRIPDDVEWTYAASNRNGAAVYPWNSDDIHAHYMGKNKNAMNKKGCFLANFCIKKYTGNLDSMKECSKQKYPNAYTTAGYLVGEDLYIAPIYSYNPNDLGLYCMSGNVAQMVNVKPLNGGDMEPGTKGGSWGSDAEHLKLNSPDEYAGQTGPSPFIGFRPVLIIQ